MLRNVRFHCSSLWKSERPVSKLEDFWKQFALLVKNRPMHDGFEGFLKQVGYLIILVNLQHWL